MVKYTLTSTLLVLFGLWSGSAFGQQVIGATGGDIVGTSYTLSFTTGEVAIQTFTGGGYILNQGFQQPTYTITSIEDNAPLSELSVFPNPTTGLITIEMKEYKGSALSFILYDLKGQEVFRKESSVGSYIKFDLDLAALSQGVYLLRVVSENQPYKTLKIVKN